MLLSGVRVGKRKRKAATTTVASTTGQSSAPTRTDDDVRSATASASINDRSAAETTTSRRVDRVDVDAAAASSSREAEVERSALVAAETTRRVDAPRAETDDDPPRRGRAVDGESKDPSVADMIREECRDKSLSLDEIYARNVARLGSRYRGTDFDEDDDRSVGVVDEEERTRMFRRAPRSNDREREISRQIARHRKQTAATARCAWWLESSSFRPRTLISAGDHVSLVLDASSSSGEDERMCLVPIRHAESFVSCDDEVWDEVKRYRAALRAMYASRGEGGGEGGEARGVLFMETVLDAKTLWQARMDVVPVPKTVEQDAPIHFRSALAEQADEWGTHNKLMKLSREKPLRRTVPKHLPYFCVEWGDDGGGYAQIVEGRGFPRDFGSDVVASMLGRDPVRLSRRGGSRSRARKRTASDEQRERADAERLADEFAKFDWTRSSRGNDDKGARRSAAT